MNKFMSTATLIALVGPSGAGKTTLARALQAAGFGRIATTTTRTARADEVLGRDLNTVSKLKFSQMRTSNEVVATCEYSSQCYGVQLKHLRAAAATGLPQIIIVEPSGLADLKRFADEAKMHFAAVFVTQSAELVRERLQRRYASEDGRAAEYADRVERAQQEVQQWRDVYAWDLIADSGDVKRDIEGVYDLVTRVSVGQTDSFAVCA
jgi:guanylate kinase